jgi:alkylation response protein AidB-like acyl-CoA dehydrogenase
MKYTGGSFLIEEHPASEVFTPADLTEEHKAIARTAREFFDREVAPNADAIQAGDRDLAVTVLRKAASLGLEAVLTPERYGGMEMDMTSVMVVAEQIAGDGSFAAWHGAHAGIGTLPLLLFGTEEQKKKYLPKLSSCEFVGAYCLTEPQTGSDAMAIKTRADLTPDGQHYVLNGQKMWITNGGKADFFTVFAKVGGEQFSAFLVERTFAGVSSGAEEHKMGIKGSSTTPVFFDNVQVPVGNLLGEIGRGHIIAFNILNIGRLKLGPFAVGGAKHVLTVSLAYAKQRKAFGHEIADFGMIRHKLAEMAIRIYAAESMAYRVEGLISGHLEGFAWGEPGAPGDQGASESDAAKRMMKAVEEFASECSMVKVYGSEMLDYVVDEGVQIHGGYGFHQDYAVERAYRDSRINRIFEGTNEINRLLITGMLLKRAQQGRLGLVKAVKGLMDEILSGPSLPDASQSEERRLVRNAKKIALLLLGSAFEKFGASMEEQQEVLAGIADVAMEVLAMDSALLRSEKTGAGADMTAVLLRDSMTRIEGFAKPVLAACGEGDALRSKMAVLRRFAKHEPVDSVGIRRRIAERQLAAGHYAVA